MAEEEYQFDPWSTTSGLPDQITVRIATAEAGYNAQIQDGKACVVTLTGTIIEGADEGHEEFDQSYTTGKGWEPGSKGAKLQREDGKPKPLNNQTAYAVLFTSLLKAAVEQKVDGELRKRGTPFDVRDLWEGLTVYMEREPYSFKDQETGQKVEKDRLVVRRIVAGVEGAGNGAQKATAAAPVKAEPTGEPDVASSTGDDLPVPLKAKLKKLARECESYREFAERAFEIDGVIDNPVAEAAIMDDGPGSIWAEVKG